MRETLVKIEMSKAGTVAPFDSAEVCLTNWDADIVVRSKTFHHYQFALGDASSSADFS